MKMLANRPLIRLEKMQSNSVITIMVISNDIVALTDNFCPFSYPNYSFSTSMFTVVTKSRPSRTYIGILVYLTCLLKPSLTKICHFIFFTDFCFFEMGRLLILTTDQFKSLKTLRFQNNCAET